MGKAAETSQDRPRETKGSRLARRLADEIVDGRLKPGAKLDEAGLAQRFEVSRTPVREALRELLSTGLVERKPHCGVVVRRIESVRLAQMFETMAELEASCARLCALRMTSEQRRRLEELHHRSTALVGSGDLAAYEAFNSRFHQMIYQGTQNPELVALCLEYRQRVAPFRRGQFNVLGRLGQSLDEHDRIVTAIMRADAQGAAEAMRLHLAIVKDASENYIATTATEENSSAAPSGLA